MRMRRFTCELNEHEEGVAPSDIIYNTVVRMRRFNELNEHEEGVAFSDILYNTIVRMRRFNKLNEHEEGVASSDNNCAHAQVHVRAERARRGRGAL